MACRLIRPKRLIAIAVALALCLPAGFAMEQAFAQEATSSPGASSKATSALNVSKPSLSNATVAKIAPVSYTGALFKPKPVVKLSGRTLKAGRDYTVSYRNNRNAGVAKVIIKGKGNYTGTKVAKFRIYKGWITKGKLTVQKRVLYTGGKVKADVTVKWGKKSLKAGRDYTVYYANNVNPGEARLLVLGKGNYKGKLRSTYKVIERPVIAVCDHRFASAAPTIKWLNECGLYDVEWVSGHDVNPNDYDGMVIPGGTNDVDPSLYGEANTSCVNPLISRDLNQFEGIRKFAKARKPILGICRGTQVINVCYGGSLYQDLGGYHRSWHTAGLAKGTWLSKLFGSTQLPIWCSHHQGVKRLAGGFKIVAVAHDSGFVEAIGHKSLPIWGLQFHPEAMGDSGAKIAHSFVAKCAKMMRGRGA